MDYLKMRELYHHGIKGQRWGIRRYQNEDGSLTAAGKAHYNTSSGISKDDLKTMKTIGKEAQNITKNASQIIPQKANKTIRKTYPNLSDDELKKRVNRLALERSYSDLVGDTKYKKAGSEIAREILQTAGAIAGIGVSIATILSVIKK